MGERIIGSPERKVPKNPLEEFVLDTLTMLHPQATITYEPFVVETSAGKITIPDILLSFPKSKADVLIEVTSSQISVDFDPKSKQYRTLREYEKENHKERKYRIAVLYGQHFISPSLTIDTFKVLKELAEGKKTEKGRKKLLNLATRVFIPENFHPTEEHLLRLNSNIKELLGIKELPKMEQLGVPSDYVMIHSNP